MEILYYNLLEFENPHVNAFIETVIEHKTIRITTNGATVIEHMLTVKLLVKLRPTI